MVSHFVTPSLLCETSRFAFFEKHLWRHYIQSANRKRLYGAPGGIQPIPGLRTKCSYGAWKSLIKAKGNFIISCSATIIFGCVTPFGFR